MMLRIALILNSSFFAVILPYPWTILSLLIAFTFFLYSIDLYINRKTYLVIIILAFVIGYGIGNIYYLLLISEWRLNGIITILLWILLSFSLIIIVLFVHYHKIIRMMILCIGWSIIENIMPTDPSIGNVYWKSIGMMIFNHNIFMQITPYLTKIILDITGISLMIFPYYGFKLKNIIIPIIPLFMITVIASFGIYMIKNKQYTQLYGHDLHVIQGGIIKSQIFTDAYASYNIFKYQSMTKIDHSFDGDIVIWPMHVLRCSDNVCGMENIKLIKNNVRIISMIQDQNGYKTIIVDNNGKIIYKNTKKSDFRVFINSLMFGLMMKDDSMIDMDDVIVLNGMKLQNSYIKKPMLSVNFIDDRVCDGHGEDRFLILARLFAIKYRITTVIISNACISAICNPLGYCNIANIGESRRIREAINIVK